ncbi:MAG: hypothetical protein ACRDVK_12735 [Acidimicrobiia bacterium]
MAQKKITASADKVELYRKLLGSIEGIDTKSNFGSAYTAINGNMYTMISKHGVVGIRLPQPERDAFLAGYHTELFRGDPAWPPAKEFVAIPDHLLSNTKVLKPFLEKSLEYVKTLKPKDGAKP